MFPVLRWSRPPLPPWLGSYGRTSEFMDDLVYTTINEPAEPLARRRDSQLRACRAALRQAALDRQAASEIL